MTWASVIVLPDPVTPRRVWYLSPRTRPAVSSWMALGWSPAGLNGATTEKLDMAQYNRGAGKYSGLARLLLPRLAAHGHQPFPLRRRHRHDRQPPHAHERRLRECGVGLDLLERDRVRQGLYVLDVDNHQLGIVRLGVGVGGARHPREPHRGLLVAGMIDDHMVAERHLAEMAQRDGIGDPVPHRPPLLGEALERVFRGLGLENPAAAAHTQR